MLDATVWTLPAMLTALVGGFLIGSILLSHIRLRYYAALRPYTNALLILGAGSLAVIVFWTGQVVDQVIVDAAFAPRVVSRALLQELFVVAIAYGSTKVFWLK